MEVGSFSRQRAAVVLLWIVACRPATSTSEHTAPITGMDGGVSDAPKGSYQAVVMDAPQVGFATEAIAVQISNPPRRNKERVLICHRGQALEVGRAALTTHLEHGDTLDVCMPARPDATAVLLQMRDGATAIAVVDVTSVASRQITEYPGVVMDVALHPLNNVLGAAPTTVVKHGGTLADGTIIHAAEEPGIRANSRYLAFFYDSSLGPRIGEALPTDGTTITLRGESLSMNQVKTILQQ